MRSDRRGVVVVGVVVGSGVGVGGGSGVGVMVGWIGVLARVWRV